MAHGVKKLLMNTQFRIIIIITILMFIPGIWSIVSGFNQTKRMMMEQTSELLLQNVIYKSKQLQDMVYDTRKLSSIASTNATITKTLSSPQKTYSQEYRDIATMSKAQQQSYEAVVKVMSNYKNTFMTYQVHNLLIGMDGTTYMSLDGISNEFWFGKNFVHSLYLQDWFLDFLESDRQSMWYAPCRYSDSGTIFKTTDPATKQKVLPYLFFARKVRDYATQEDLGTSIVSLYMNNLNEILSVENNSMIVLMDRDHQVIYSNNNNLKEIAETDIQQALKTGESLAGKSYCYVNIKNDSYIAVFQSIPETEWCVYLLKPVALFTADIMKFRSSALTMNIVVLIIALVLCIYMINVTLGPINHLLKRASAMRIGDYVVGGEEKELHSISQAEESFTALMNRLEAAVDKALEKQQLENQLQYEALRAQINPHFLFNTLNTIKWSALICGAENIADMISDLGTLLEKAMSKGDDLIPLAEELTIVQSYIRLKNMTLKYQVELRVETARELEAYRLMKFTVQPIVENSIIHGFEKKADGKIHIRAYQDEKLRTVIEIADNGYGMNAGKTEELNQILASGQSRHFSGIGLQSIHKMIRLRYGEPYGITITSSSGEGTVVTILLPMAAA